MLTFSTVNLPQMTMNDFIIVLTTHPDIKQAVTLAEEIVASHLAACINILPQMTSIYRWKGKIEHGNEFMLVIKTQRKCYSKLETLIKIHHPYELPEIIAVTVETGLADYLTWIQENTA